MYKIAIKGEVDSGKTTFISKLLNKSIFEENEITQNINFYKYNEKIILIDVPGHVFYKIERNISDNLADLIILIIDISKNISESSLIKEILPNKKYHIFLNKIDKINEKEIQYKIKLINSILNKLNYYLSLEIFEEDLNLINYNLISLKEINKNTFNELFKNIINRKIEEIAKKNKIIEEFILKSKIENIYFEKYNSSNLKEIEKERFYIFKLNKTNFKKNEDKILKLSLIYENEFLKENNLLDLKIIFEGEVIKEIKRNKNKYEFFIKFISNNFNISSLNLKLIKLDLKINSYQIRYQKEEDFLNLYDYFKNNFEEEKITFIKGYIEKKDINLIQNKLSLKYSKVIFGFRNFNKVKEEKEDLEIINDNLIFNFLNKLENIIKFRKKYYLEKIPLIKMLENHLYRNFSPIIIGIKIINEMVEKGDIIYFKKGEKIGVIEELKLNNKLVEECEEGKEVCIKYEGNRINSNIFKDELYVLPSKRKIDIDLISKEEFIFLKNINYIK